MERKIGEIFEYNGEWYQCVESQDGSCKHCDMNFKGKCPIPIKECTESGRSDKSYVIFKKLEKVGEPYRRWLSPFNNIMVQRYRLYGRNVIMPDEPIMLLEPNYKNSVEIEIKQTKEDMEEKKIKLRQEDVDYIRRKFKEITQDYIIQGCDKEKVQFGFGKLFEPVQDVENEEKKLNLKPFDLEAARSGKPVCTRDGHKARIICFDRRLFYKNASYPILALVECYDGEDDVCGYNEKGKVLIEDGAEYKDDLMMLPEKKEGWINVKKDASLFKSREEAERNCTKDYVPVRVEFEI